MSHIYKLAKKFEKKLTNKSRSAKSKVKNMNKEQLFSHLESLSQKHNSFKKALQKAKADLDRAQHDLEQASEMAESTRKEMEKYHKILQNLNLTGGKKIVHRKDIISYLTDEGDMVVDEDSVLPYKEWKKKSKSKTKEDEPEEFVEMSNFGDFDELIDEAHKDDSPCDCADCGDMSYAHDDNCDCSYCE